MLGITEHINNFITLSCINPNIFSETKTFHYIYLRTVLAIDQFLFFFFYVTFIFHCILLATFVFVFQNHDQIGLLHFACMPVSQTVIHLPIQSVNQLVELHLEFNTSNVPNKEHWLLWVLLTITSALEVSSAHTWLKHTRQPGKQTHYTSITYNLQQLSIFSDNTLESSEIPWIIAPNELSLVILNVCSRLLELPTKTLLLPWQLFTRMELVLNLSHFFGLKTYDFFFVCMISINLSYSTFVELYANIHDQL